MFVAPTYSNMGSSSRN